MDPITTEPTGLTGPAHQPAPAHRVAGRHSHRCWRAVAPIALCAVLGAGAVACGGGDSTDDAADELAEQIAEASGDGNADVEIDSDSGQVDVETSDGQFSVGESTELPEDFPSDIPLPADYELTSAITSTTEGSEGWTLSGTLPDATEDTFDDLVAQFTDDGWTNQSDASGMTGGGTASTAMLDNGTWSVIVSVQVGVDDMPDSFSYVVTPAV